MPTMTESGANVSIRIDGRTVSAPAGATIWEAADSCGIAIPRLCHQPGLEPVGVCRVCAVELEGGRALAPACHRRVEGGMVIHTKSERVTRSIRTLVEMLMADQPPYSAEEGGKGSCDLEALARELGVLTNGGPRLSARPLAPPADLTSPVIAVDHAACILCDRCVRACSDVQSNEVIGRGGRGPATRIVFDADLPMGESSCVACGECVAACPTRALTNKVLTLTPPSPGPGTGDETNTVDSVCPFCGVGCGITYRIRENVLAGVEGIADHPGSHGRLCVKGRYGYDYPHHPDRLTVPLIRKEGAPKDPPGPEEGFANARSLFREASWEEAMSLAASRLTAIRDARGPSALAGFGSAKCSNEEGYLFQKLVRAVFGTNNVDHCTRLCHASSVAAVMETIGSGAVSNVFNDAMKADVIVVAGSNPTENHPVAATVIKEAAKAGAALIVIDPRRIDLCDHADIFASFRPGTDVALFNGFLHVVIAEGLIDKNFVAQRTEGFEALADAVKPYTPATAAKITGVPAKTIREIARRYATAESAIVFWGMGLSQHTTGTDNCRALIALCLVCGQIGRPGTGLHPLRGQNNVQGASDTGVIPMVYPGYQSVTDPKVREKFEDAWGRPLDPEAGLTVVEIMNAAKAGGIRGMYIMGENPAMSDPNLNHSRECLAALEFLVVQDIFLTETAAFADVVLPATAFPEKEGTYTNTDRRVQIGRKAIDPPEGVRTDWRIVAEMGTRMGYPMPYESAEEIFDEMAALTPSYAGIRYGRLTGHGVVWPCPAPDHPGTETLFTESFPTESGKGRLVPVSFAPAKELPDRNFPFVLNTGRNLYHWHTGAMTRRARALETSSPTPYADMNEADMKRLRIRDGETVTVRSRRGEVSLQARRSPKQQPGQVFIPFHYVEAAANLLTIDALDPYGKIPEYKVCAVRVEKV